MNIKLKNSPPSKFFDKLFFLFIIFVIVFCNNEASDISSRIVVFYIKANTPYLVFFSLFGIFIFKIISKKLRLDKLSVALLIRFGLYTISCLIAALLLTGLEFKIGVYLATLSAFFAYYVGRSFSVSRRFFSYGMLLFASCISAQIIQTVIINGLSFFSLDLKWFMVIPIGQTNAIGTHLLLAIVFIDDYRKRTDSKIDKLVFTIGEIVSIVACMLTGSRASIIIVIIYLLASNFTSIKRKLTKKQLVLIGISCIGLGYVMIFKISSIVQIMELFNFESLTNSRFEVYNQSLNLFMDNPIWGRGAFPYQVYDTARTHNLFLEALVEGGIVGCGIFIYSLWLLVKKIKKKPALWYALIVIILRSMVEPTFYAITFETFFWIIFGIGIAIEKNQINYENKSITNSGRI